MKTNADSCPHWEWHYRTLSRLRDALLRARSEPAAPSFPVGFAFEADSETALDEYPPGETPPDDSDVREIEAALERIRNGTYGICELTGERIPAGRLREMPWTRVARSVARPTAACEA